MNASHPVRIGAVSYLNTKPLVCGLERRAEGAVEGSAEGVSGALVGAGAEAAGSRSVRVGGGDSADGELRLPNGRPIELSFDLPSRLADRLAARELDVALIPSVEYLQDADYTIVSDACIACRGPVWSVKLYSRTPVERIRRLALDEGSRTSAALTRILLDRRFGVRPELEMLPIGSTLSDTGADAVLLIGDRAIHAPEPDETGAVEQFAEIWDLGREWSEWTGLSFVFAMWVARRDEVPAGLAEILETARDRGLARLREIAAVEAPRMRLDVESCLSYLRDNLYFHLGPRERRGLERFRDYATALGIAPATASAATP